MPIVALSQLPIEMSMEWYEGDPVALTFVINNLDWSSASYTGQVSGVALTVTDALETDVGDGIPNTRFTFTMTAALSAALKKGDHSFSVDRVSDGLTMFYGKVYVRKS